MLESSFNCEQMDSHRSLNTYLSSDGSRGRGTPLRGQLSKSEITFILNRHQNNPKNRTSPSLLLSRTCGRLPTIWGTVFAVYVLGKTKIEPAASPTFL